MALRESMDGLFEALEQQTDHFRHGTKMVQDQFPDAGKLIGASGGKGPRS
jgi:type I restriction enzyme M protein